MRVDAPAADLGPSFRRLAGMDAALVERLGALAKASESASLVSRMPWIDWSHGFARPVPGSALLGPASRCRRFISLTKRGASSAWIGC